jgi:hydroxymethylpyrimidine/phosphomethylpyrimidine kinase
VNTVLVIAGLDSSGGAGVVRDLYTLAHFGTAAACALTAVTAQSDAAVLAVQALPPQLVQAQIASALAARAIGAVKIGMLADGAVAAAVGAALPPRAQLPVVLDPVLAASSGARLLDAAGERVLRTQLLGRATLLTPNLPEAAALLDTAPARSVTEQVRQAQALCALGPEAVLIKGGHGDGAEAVDVLVRASFAPREFRAARHVRGMRGSGCTLASAIAAALAAGVELGEACARARGYVLELLAANS